MNFAITVDDGINLGIFVGKMGVMLTMRNANGAISSIAHCSNDDLRAFALKLEDAVRWMDGRDMTAQAEAEEEANAQAQ